MDDVKSLSKKFNKTLTKLKKEDIQTVGDIPPELLLCEMEIVRLRDKASISPLSLEDTKKFSILVNDLISIKKFLREKNKSDEEDFGLEQNEEELLASLKK